MTITTDSRRKILLLSDHPLAPSGVGTQAKYLIEGLLGTGKYRFICLGGAIKHPDYRIQNVAPDRFGDRNWLILPVDGHGNKDILRRVISEEKPDAVVIFTDPRFFYWVWEMEDEVRAVCPLVYWHVWDNDPVPEYNSGFYKCTDHIAALSLKTYGLLQGLKYDENRFSYIPHAEPTGLFKPLPEDEIMKLRASMYGPHGDPKRFIVFWNNRNARRKHPGDVMQSFASFLDLDGVQRDRCSLMMHTRPDDPEGQDLTRISKHLGIEQNMIFSTDIVDSAQLNAYYNAADVTINIASNEGFGLTTLESIFAGTPIVANFTGGLQFQLGDWWKDVRDFSSQEDLTKIARKSWAAASARRARGDDGANWWGAPVFPEVRNLVGSQATPYIYDDNVSNDQVAKAILGLYRLGRKRRREIGARGSEWVHREFGMNKMIQSWDNMLTNVINSHTKFEIRIASV